MLKDMDEQPDGKIHRTRSGRVLNAGTFVPMKLGYTTLQHAIDMFTNPEALQNPDCWDILGGSIVEA